MKSRPCIWMSAACLVAALATTIQLIAQDNAPNNNHQPRYRLIEIGTFGGPNSLPSGGPPSLHLLNNSGMTVGIASTATADPYYPNCWVDCFVDHAFRWQNGVLRDLGALPGVTSSGPTGINEFGLATGVSENGSIDPLTGFPEYNGVVWNNGTIMKIGTFGGSLSYALGVNDWGQVVGGAENTILDGYTGGFPCLDANCWPAATQWRAFFWQNGAMSDLGTLGGNDAFSMLINDFGQVSGVSYTNTTPNPTTGVPTMDPFLWQNHRMIDLGTLGGTYGYPNWMNIWGQVAGQSNLTGDQSFHPFLWDGIRMRDLGTLGGETGSANWVNDLGEVVGQADLPGSGTQPHHGFLWNNGKMTDLGVVSPDPCSRAESINLQGQIVGNSGGTDGDCGAALHAFLWENGAIYDLNLLIPLGSGLTLIEAVDIDDSGEIMGLGLLANGEERAYLLVPCDQHDPGRCTNQLLETTDALSHPAVSPDKVDQLRTRLARFNRS